MNIKDKIDTKRKIVSYIDLLDLINNDDFKAITICKNMAYSNAKYIMENYDIKDALALINKDIKEELEIDRELSFIIKDEEIDKATSFLNWCLIYEYLNNKNEKERIENYNNIKNSLYRLLVLNLESEIKKLDDEERENLVVNVLPNHIVDWYMNGFKEVSNGRK